MTFVCMFCLTCFVEESYIFQVKDCEYSVFISDAALLKQATKIPPKLLYFTNKSSQAPDCCPPKDTQTYIDFVNLSDTKDHF